MGKVGGFKEIAREEPLERPIAERVKDYREVHMTPPEDKLRNQAARCMACGVPFCNNGCPLGNLIPDWNDAVYRGEPRVALELLLKTNNFPEFTGRVCPAPCEESCVLNLQKEPVSIKAIEENIVERAFAEGWIKPNPPLRRTGKQVAVVGSGPSGLSCAAQLNSVGHMVTVFERSDRLGGLLTYGIPGFKLEKRIVERRIDLMREEGVKFSPSARTGDTTFVTELLTKFDALALCCGSTKAREITIPGRELAGVHLAMEYLTQQNRADLGDPIPDPERILASGKNVIVIGGGDTGADCIGTALRQGARSVRQFEILPEPPRERTIEMPWPVWPVILRESAAHQEARAILGVNEVREFSVCTKSFLGAHGKLEQVRAARVVWKHSESGRMIMAEVENSEFELPCELCLLAAGFVHPEHEGLVKVLGLELDQRGNVKTDANYHTNVAKVFSAGDMRRGQSLVVWAISEGRQVARAIDTYLMGRSDLPELHLI
jgi:glutamate synthase (NADPH) small chain